MKDDLNRAMDGIATSEGGSDSSPYIERATRHAEEERCLGRDVDDEWIKKRARKLYEDDHKDVEPPEFDDGYGYREWYSGKDVERMVSRLRDTIEKEIQIGLNNRKSITKAQVKDEYEKEIEQKYSNIYSRRMAEFFQSLMPMAAAVVAAILMNILPYPWKLVTIPFYAYVFVSGFKTMKKINKTMAELKDTKVEKTSNSQVII